VVPKAELEELIIPRSGQIFDRKLITATQELIQNRLGRDGYAFAKVEPVSTPDNANHTVALTYFIDPGNRVYVRNISFSGSKRINDEVLRREMRQLEGGWLSNTSLERGKQRLQRLPFIKTVDFETTPVTGTPDLVDVNYKIEEGPASTLGGGIGYSETYKFTLNGNYVDSNFLGTGQRVAVELNGGAFSKVYSIQETNPYTSIDGLQRTLSVTYRDVTQFVSNSSNFSSQTLSVGPTWAYPVSEFQFVRLGAVFNSSQLLVNTSSSAIQAQDWVRSNGNPYTRLAHDDASNNYYVFYGTDFKTVELVGGWDYDSRNRSLFPDRGMRAAVSVSATVPTGSVEYWIGNISFQRYVPLWKGFTLSFFEGFDYGQPLGNTTAIPPFRQMFGGGPDSVRGFRESFLGPKDQFGNPYGGNMRITSQNELILPMPSKWKTSARAALFFDMGNVFQTGTKVPFYAPDAFTPINYNLNGFNDLKRSVGVAVQWLAPMGLFRFSFGHALNATHFNPSSSWGDQTEGFQFSIGNAF
jgi:outer membrane protein insertion porin family